LAQQGSLSRQQAPPPQQSAEREVAFAVPTSARAATIINRYFIDEDCTFETLLRRFSVVDKALRKIGEMVHDADLDDEKFQRDECIGIDRVLKGWAKLGISDDELLQRGGACFDGLYSFLQRL
jgi:hypothetical protein